MALPVVSARTEYNKLSPNAKKMFDAVFTDADIDLMNYHDISRPIALINDYKEHYRFENMLNSDKLAYAKYINDLKEQKDDIISQHTVYTNKELYDKLNPEAKAAFDRHIPIDAIDSIDKEEFKIVTTIANNLTSAKGKAYNSQETIDKRLDHHFANLKLWDNSLSAKYKLDNFTNKDFILSHISEEELNQLTPRHRHRLLSALHRALEDDDEVNYSPLRRYHNDSKELDYTPIIEYINTAKRNMIKDREKYEKEQRKLGIQEDINVAFPREGGIKLKAAEAVITDKDKEILTEYAKLVGNYSMASHTPDALILKALIADTKGDTEEFHKIIEEGTHPSVTHYDDYTIFKDEINYDDELYDNIQRILASNKYKDLKHISASLEQIELPEEHSEMLEYQLEDIEDELEDLYSDEPSSPAEHQTDDYIKELISKKAYIKELINNPQPFLYRGTNKNFIEDLEDQNVIRIGYLQPESWSDDVTTAAEFMQNTILVTPKPKHNAPSKQLFQVLDGEEQETVYGTYMPYAVLDIKSASNPDTLKYYQQELLKDYSQELQEQKDFFKEHKYHKNTDNVINIRDATLSYRDTIALLKDLHEMKLNPQQYGLSYRTDLQGLLSSHGKADKHYRAPLLDDTAVKQFEAIWEDNPNISIEELNKKLLQQHNIIHKIPNKKEVAKLKDNILDEEYTHSNEDGYLYHLATLKQTPKQKNLHKIKMPKVK